MEIVEDGELDELYREAARMRNMAEAVKAAVEFMERRSIWIERWVRIIQFRKSYSGEEGDEDDG